MIIRRRSGLGSGIFMGALFLLIAFNILAFAESGRGTWFVIMLSAMGLSLMFVQPRIELDFGKHRFRTFSFSLFASGSDFKDLPKLDRIQVRDVTHKGGRTSAKGSWGDTFSYEVFLMSVADEKLVVCERPNRTKVRSIVQQLVEASGLPVRDVTKDRILAKEK